MTVRNDDHIERYLDIDSINNRDELRKYMLYLYATEDCKTKVRYYVEALENGKRIYIERPTFLNKGCDFVLYVEDLIIYKNGNDKAPSHSDLLGDLKKKKNILSSNDYQRVIIAIQCIYNVQPYNVAKSYIDGLPNIGWSYELVLKLIRWFFIEQDITYWAGEGREMLFNAILRV